MTWADDHPESVPARWLRGELDGNTAIVLGLLSEDLATRIWAGHLLAARYVKPRDLIKLTSVC